MDRSNTFGLFLTPIVRPAITGNTPLALVDAPQAGTGKSLLADVLSIIATGRPASMTPLPKDDAEVAKLIGATLLQGRALICFDNVESVISSPTLAMAITAAQYETRILGVTQTLVAPNRATWLATGNNIRPSGDIPRRCYRIRLDAKTSKPFLGRKFRHPDLIEWVTEHRSQLLRSLLIMTRAWFARGRENFVPQALGSFHEWHRMVGGTLETAGIHGFLSNLNDILETDEMALQWESFLAELLQENPEWFMAADIANSVRDATNLNPCPYNLPDSFGDIDLRKIGTLKRAIGQSFQKRVGRRFGERGLYLEKKRDPHLKISKWRVRQGGNESLLPYCGC